jgi:beta-galactosidase
MAGIEVSDLSPLHKPFAISSQSIKDLDGAHAQDMADEIHPMSAEVLAVYAEGWRKGLPVLTRNRWGQGWVYYLGSVLEGHALGVLVDALLAQAGIIMGLETPEGVFAYERRSPNTRLMFLLNHNEHPAHVTLADGWKDVFTEQTCSEVEIEPVGVRILKAAV